MTNSVGAFFYRYGYVWSMFFILWAFSAISRGGRAFGAFPFILFLGLMYEPIGFSAFFFFFFSWP